jgi:hypothetical protein
LLKNFYSNIFKIKQHFLMSTIVTIKLNNFCCEELTYFLKKLIVEISNVFPGLQGEPGDQGPPGAEGREGQRGESGRPAISTPALPGDAGATGETVGDK